MQKVEGMMIVVGFLVVFVGLAAHLIIAAVEAKKLKSLGDNECNDEEDLEDNLSEENVKISGTLESIRDYRGDTDTKKSKRTKK